MPKILFSIRTKLTAFIIVISISLLGFFSYFTLTVFISDKKKDLEEFMLHDVQSIQSKFESYYNSLVLAVNDLYRQNLKGSQVYKDNVVQYKLIHAFIVKDKKNKILKQYWRPDLLIEFELNDDLIEQMLLSCSVGPRGFSKFDEEFICLNMISTNEIYHSLLIPQNSLSEVLQLANSNSKLIFDNSQLQHPHFIEMLKKQGAFPVLRKMDKVVLAGIFLNDLRIGWYTELSDEKIYEPIKFIVIRSIQITLILIAVFLLISVFIAARMTAQIEELSIAARKIASGFFDNKLIPRSGDEIGILVKSVDQMQRDLSFYLKEQAEKMRMGEELKVASLVQQSFFQKQPPKTSKFDFFAYYKSATECGGDYWIVQEHQGCVYIFIGDATGHGVPSALLTASVDSSIKQILLSQHNHGPAIGPGLMLERINKVLLSYGNDFFMTAFLAIYDPSSMVMTYARASHNPPLLFRTSAMPLELVNGARLGEVYGEEYPESKVMLEVGDVLCFYTDGLIDYEKSDGKKFGKRNLIKSFNEKASKTCDELGREIIMSLEKFSEIQQGDDISFVIMKVGK